MQNLLPPMTPILTDIFTLYSIGEHRCNLWQMKHCLISVHHCSSVVTTD